MVQETIQSLLKKSVAFFEEKGVDEAKRTAELLLAHALGAKRIDLYVRFEQPMRDDELAVFRECVRRRLRGEPVQYILGETEFYGLPMHVAPSVLIPRPETEHVVEAAIDILRARAGQGGPAAGGGVSVQMGSVFEEPPGIDEPRTHTDEPRTHTDEPRTHTDEPQTDTATREHIHAEAPASAHDESDGIDDAAVPAAPALHVLDIGTGSGCIAIAIAKHVRGVHVTAVDVSAEAISVAAENARLNGVDAMVELHCADVMRDGHEALGRAYDLVVSNPPYIPAEEIRTLQSEVRDHEPHTALTDHADGLTFYRRIASLLPAMLSPGGACVLEIGHGQSDAIRGIFTSAGHAGITITKDYSGIPRVFTVRV